MGKKKADDKGGNTTKKPLPADDDFYTRFLPSWAEENIDEIEDADLEMRRANSRYSKADLVKVLTDRLQAALTEGAISEDYRDQDIRILFAFVGSFTGAYTALRLKYPKDAVAIQGMIAIFAFVFAVVSYIDIYKVGMSCFYSIKNKVGGPTIRCGFELPDFSDQVTISVADDEQKLEFTKSVGNYIDEDGFVVDKDLVNDFFQLLQKLTSVRMLRDEESEYYQKEVALNQPEKA